MNRVVYHIGDKKTTSYAKAIALKDSLHLPVTISYEPLPNHDYDYQPQTGSAYIKRMKHYGFNV